MRPEFRRIFSLTRKERRFVHTDFVFPPFADAASLRARFAWLARAVARLFRRGELAAPRFVIHTFSVADPIPAASFVHN